MNKENEEIQEEVLENTEEDSQEESVEDLKALVEDEFDDVSEDNFEDEDPFDDIEVPEEPEDTDKEPEEDESETQKDKEDDTEEEPEEDNEDSEKEGIKPESPQLEVKINGEIKKLTLDEIEKDHPEVLEDLKAGVSGRKEVQRRFSELDREKKEFYSEKEQVEQYIQTFGEHVKDGNILGGLQFFAEFAGLPPYVVKEQLIASVRPEIEKRFNMSQDEINNQRLKEENEYLAQKNESDQKRWEREQAELQQQQKHAELQAQIQSIRETHNITEEEWDTALDELDKVIPQDQPITKEMVRDHIVEQKQSAEVSSKIDAAISSHKEKLEELGTEGLSEELEKIIKAYPDLTNEELSEVVKQAIKIREEEILKQKLASKTSKQPKPIQKDEDEELKKLRESLDEDF